MHRIYVRSLLVLLTTLTACSARSPEATFSNDVQTIASWAATAHMVGDAWSQGSVPKAYATQTLQRATEELDTTQKSLSKSPVPQHDHALQELQTLKTTIAHVSSAIEKDDRAALSQPIQQLSQQEQTIKALADQESK